MKKIILGLAILGSMSSFSSVSFNGTDAQGNECNLTIHSKSSNGMVIATTHTKKMFLPQAIHLQGDQVILDKSELRKTEVNENMNVHEKVVSVSLSQDGTPTSYSVYDRKTLPVVGSLFPETVNCRL